VTITSNIPATIRFSTDGNDPHTSPTARELASPAKITLTGKTSLKYFARTDAGAESEVASADYDRVHYASGAVVVGASKVGQTVTVALAAGGQQPGPGDSVDLVIDHEGEYPFEFDNLEDGAYQITASVQGALEMPQILQFTLSPAHPSATGLKLYLGAAKPGTGTLSGTVTFGKAVPSKALAVIALPSSAISSGGLGNLDPSSLNTFVALTTTDLTYPYSITNIAPGSYIPLCAVADPSGGMNLGSGPFNALINPISTKQVAADGTATANFAYGSSTLQGNLTLQLSKALPTGTTPKVVVAARTGLLGMWELVNLPTTVALVDGSTTEYTGTFTVEALQDSKSFEVKVFATTDGSDPSAMSWLFSPTSQGDKTVTTNGSTSQVDLTVSVTVP
jgi:hypothetical protein